MWSANQDKLKEYRDTQLSLLSVVLIVGIIAIIYASWFLIPISLVILYLMRVTRNKTMALESQVLAEDVPIMENTPLTTSLTASLTTPALAKNQKFGLNPGVSLLSTLNHDITKDAYEELLVTDSGFEETFITDGESEEVLLTDGEFE